MRPYQTGPARQCALLAGASLIAMAVACSEVSAADLPVKASAAIVKDEWSWWAEGGFTGPPAGDASIGFVAPAIASYDPGPGWEAAIGFDYRRADWSPYHVIMQFRYGENARGWRNFVGGPFPLTLTTPLFLSPTTANLIARGADHGFENHWLVDFAVGRDFALGSGGAQGTLGIRIAEITSIATGDGTLLGCTATNPITAYPFCTRVSGNVAFQSRSRFLGVGPRLGIQGGQPLGGSWVFEYLGAVALLFGERSVRAAQLLDAISTGRAFTAMPTTGLASSDVAAVFNLDAQLGVSYWVTPAFKLTASYRFDGYWGALPVLEAAAIRNQDRFYFGPMLRATVTF
jgi:hypothetical protein